MLRLLSPSKNSHRRCSIKSCSYKICNIHRKTPVLESLFSKVEGQYSIFNQKNLTRFIVFVFDNMFVVLFYSNTIVTVIALNNSNSAFLVLLLFFFISAFICSFLIKNIPFLAFVLFDSPVSFNSALLKKRL